MLAQYPALKSVADAVDPAWWRFQAAEAAAAGETAKSTGLGSLGDAADLVKGADPAAVADGHAFLHKSFTDMYPTEHCSPSAPAAPGRYQRPYLSAGHASEDASHKGSAAIPPSRHVPEPEDYQRPLITAGHEAPSPANTPGNNRVAPGSPSAARSYYTNSARDQARTALAAMHDHIAGSFPDLCPMAASKTVLPPDMGAKNVPHAVTPQVTGGAFKEGSGGGGIQAVRGELVSLTAANPAVSEKALRKMIRKALREMPPASVSQAPPLDAEVLRTVMSEQIALLTEKYDTQISELRKDLGELGSQPDPALAPLRGALARPSGTAVPVERRSLVDEAQADAVRKEAAEAHRLPPVRRGPVAFPGSGNAREGPRRDREDVRRSLARRHEILAGTAPYDAHPAHIDHPLPELEFSQGTQRDPAAEQDAREHEQASGDHPAQQMRVVLAYPQDEAQHQDDDGLRAKHQGDDRYHDERQQGGHIRHSRTGFRRMQPP